MKKSKLFMLLSSAMMVFAALVFTSCVDDNEDNGMPYLEVSPDVLNFDADGKAVGASEFEVKTNRPWKLTIEDGQDWVRPSAVEGKGSAKVSFNVFPSAVGQRAKLTFSLSNAYGSYLTKDVYIQQGEAPKAGPVSELVAYIKTTWPLLESGTEDLGYSQKTIEAVVLANNEYGNNFGKLYVGDNITLPNSAIVLYDTKLFTKAGSVNYPVGKKVTLDLSAAQYSPFGNLRELKNVVVTVSDADAVTIAVPSLSAAQLNTGNYQGQYVQVNDLTPQSSFVGQAWATAAKRAVKLDGTDDKTIQSYMSTATDAVDFASLYIANKTGALYGTAEQNFTNMQVIPTKPSDVGAFVSNDPTITVTPADNVVVGAAKGATTSISITGNVAWTVEKAGDGFTIDPVSGDGNGKITVTAAAANATQAAKNLGTITIKNTVGNVVLAVSQLGKVDALFLETFGDLNDKLDPWPYINSDAALPYLIKSGYGFQSGSSYESSGASVRWSATTSPEAATAGFSGYGHMWLAAPKDGTPSYFEAKDLVLTNETGIDFSFGVLANTNAFDIAKDKPAVYVSYDNTNWTKIDQYTVSEVLNGTKWKKISGSYDFTVATKQLSFKLAYEFDASINKSGLRIEDVTLVGRTGGVLPPVDPAVATADATNVLETTATVGGSLANAEIANYSAVGIQYAQTPSSGSVNWASATKVAATNKVTPWTVNLTGLTAGKGYTFRAYATPNAGTEIFGAEKTFKTKDNGGTGGDGSSLTLDFSRGVDMATPALPTNATTNTDGTYVIDGKTYVIHAADKFYWWINTYQDTKPASLFIGKAGSYIEFPAVAGKALTGVTVDQAIGGGSAVAISVKSAAGVDVAGAATTINGGETAVLTLSGTSASTKYRLYVDNAKNLHIAKLVLTYGDGGGSQPQTPEITSVNPASLTWAATATDAKPITVSGSNLSGVTLTATSSAATSAFAFAVSGTTVTVTPKAVNTGAADITETLTIAAPGGNSKTVALTQSKPSGGGAAQYTVVTKIANMTAGTYYLAGFAKDAYNIWNGKVSSGQCETSAYTFAAETGALTATGTDDAAAVSLVAVSGVANAYYIKIGAQYLSVKADGKNQLELVDAADNNYWTLSDFDDNGFKAEAKAFASNMFTSVSAASKYIRSYVTTTTSGVGGISFIKKK